ncbi:hypothetical protein [Streptomyces sp. NPDC051561]|uniref:hypothetical protein n=1 Tax=Streptomyces sp. NPDC051561 TaxID=3365658 RepID=UPI0037B4C8A9
MRQYGKAALAAAVAGLLAGCSAPGGSGDRTKTPPEAPSKAPVAVGPAATPAGPTSTEMPFAAYLPGERELAAIQRAESVLLNSCMAEFGFTTHIDAHSDAELLADLRGGTTLPRTPAEAAAYGFHNVPAAADPPERSSPDPRQADRLLVLGGADPRPAPDGAPATGPDRKVNGKAVERGGCAGRTERALAVGSPAEKTEHPGNSALNTLLRLRSEAWAQGAKDPAYTRMTAAWSACMRTAGFRYATFDAAAEDPAWTRTAKAGSREKAAAGADLRCRGEVNYLGVSEAVHLAYERRAVQDNAATLTSLKAHYDAVARNSAKVSKDS